MTTNLHALAVNTAQAQIELAEAEAAFTEAKADHARWERLTAAASRVKKLTPVYEKARAAYDNAVAAETSAKSDARFAGLANLHVADTSSGGADGGGVLRMSWRITWTKPGHDPHTMTTVAKQHGANGFRAIEDHALAFLIEKHPELIPAEIMALAPGDPAAAMEEYFRACQRGYVRGKAAA